MNVVFNPVIRENFKAHWISIISKLLPRFRGDWLLCCPLFSLLPQDKRIVNVEIAVHDKRLFSVDFNICDPPQYTMVKRARYDLGSALAVWFLLKQGDVFIDVGANHGYLSAVAAQKVGDSGLVISLEPNLEAFKQLLRCRIPNLFPLNFAISDSNRGRLTIKKPFYRQTTSGFCKEGTSVKKTTVDYIYEKFNKPSVKFLKVDTEGMELLILLGAKKLLMEKSPYVMLELEERHVRRYGYEISDVLELMGELGYNRCYRVDNRQASVSSSEFIENSEILFSKKKLVPSEFNV